MLKLSGKSFSGEISMPSSSSISGDISMLSGLLDRGEKSMSARPSSADEKSTLSSSSTSLSVSLDAVMPKSAGSKDVPVSSMSGLFVSSKSGSCTVKSVSKSGKISSVPASIFTESSLLASSTISPRPESNASGTSNPSSSRLSMSFSESGPSRSKPESIESKSWEVSALSSFSVGKISAASNSERSFCSCSGKILSSLKPNNSSTFTSGTGISLGKGRSSRLSPHLAVISGSFAIVRS